MKHITPTQLRELRQMLSGGGKVLTLPADRALYSQDLGFVPDQLRNLFFHFVPTCVIQPCSETDLAEAIRFCSVQRIPVITRTSASSGFGNVIPTDAEVVIDLGLLNRVMDFDLTVPSVTVQAGARWADVDRFVGEKGYTLYTYPSSYYSSVGGWVVTGGLGIHSLRFGHLKNHVTSLRVILPMGEVRDVPASDPWFDRFFGTEGQLGVVTQITLKVRTKPNRTLPLLVSFDAEDQAFEWMRGLMGRDAGCIHLKLMGLHVIDEISRFYGESLIEPKPSVLAVFEEDGDRSKLATDSGSKAPEYLARFFWHERLFPLRMNRPGSSLLASETLFDDSDAPTYVRSIRRLARRLGFELLVEAHAVEPHRLLLMPHFLCESGRPLRYALGLILTAMLTQMAVNQGGVPYGLGIWNSPFIGNKFDARSLRLLRGWKDEVDPGHRFNPRRYFRVGTRFLNIPGQTFRPWIFQSVMRMLIATSPLWARVARFLASDRAISSKPLTSMETAALLCSHCGSCLSVCPAYRVLRDEAVTARSKLRLIRKVSEGQNLTPHEVERVFLCLHCHACERICQSRLRLVEAWEELEDRVARAYGTPAGAMEKFMRDVGESDEYRRMVDTW